MVDGLLKCRGPASKTDIIAAPRLSCMLPRMPDPQKHPARPIKYQVLSLGTRATLCFQMLQVRLKTALLVKMMTGVCEKLGIDY